MSKALVDDEIMMLEAVRMARMGLGHTRPNPPVGAVIAKGDEIIGVGYHHFAGGDHAEVDAIKNAKRHRKSVVGATMYVTLEPCSKAGRVGACTDAIAASGIAKVVYECDDPNPVNRGKAKRALAKAGVICERRKIEKYDVVHGMAEELIKQFTKHVKTGLPFVTVKIAMSLDGRICDDKGDAKWISSKAARDRVGEMRGVVDAIMVGAETIRRDNPSLLWHGGKRDDLVRVVVSRSGKLPKNAQVFTDGKGETLVFPDAELAIRELGKAGITHVLCEGGMQLAISLAEAGLVDEWITVLAPKVIGSRPIGKAIRIPVAHTVEDFFEDALS